MERQPLPTTDAPHEGPHNPSRRSALAVILGGVSALAAGALALAAGFLSNAWGRSPARPWARIGRAEDLEAETFRQYVIHIEHRHAWMRERQSLTVFVKDLFPDDPLALLSRCSHLGCSVKWDEESDRFRCPCHGGVYDETGQVVAGPPPRALTRLEVKIEDEVFFVRLPAPGQKDTEV